MNLLLIQKQYTHRQMDTIEDLDDEEEYDSDYEPPISFNSMAMNTDKGSNDDDDGHKADTEDSETLEELYKLSSDGLEAKTPKSILLPTYDAEVGGTIRKMLIDTGASTVYVSKSLVNEISLKTTKVRARKVKVADNDTHVVDRITTVDIKLGNLPAETLTAYVFPLKEIDLCLRPSVARKAQPSSNKSIRIHGEQSTLYPTSSNKSESSKNTNRRS